MYVPRHIPLNNNVASQCVIQTHVSLLQLEGFVNVVMYVSSRKDECNSGIRRQNTGILKEPTFLHRSGLMVSDSDLDDVLWRGNFVCH